MTVPGARSGYTRTPIAGVVRSLHRYYAPADRLDLRGGLAQHRRTHRWRLLSGGRPHGAYRAPLATKRRLRACPEVLHDGSKGHLCTWSVPRTLRDGANVTAPMAADNGDCAASLAFNSDRRPDAVLRLAAPADPTRCMFRSMGHEEMTKCGCSVGCRVILFSSIPRGSEFFVRWARSEMT